MYYTALVRDEAVATDFFLFIEKHEMFEWISGIQIHRSVSLKKNRFQIEKKRMERLTQ